MGQRLSPQFVFQDQSTGVIQKVSSKIAPLNSVKHAINLVFDEEFGYSVVRKGCTLLGTQIVAENNIINGLYQFVDSEAGANSHLLATLNAVGDATAVTYYYNGSSWVSSLTGDTPSLKTRFVTFLDSVARLNGTDSVKSWSGTGSWTTTGGALDVANFPKGKFACVYKAQIVVAGVTGSPDTLYISSVPDSGGTQISWTVDDRQIVINPADSSNITGMGVLADLLIVFKNGAMYRWNNRSIEADVVVPVGCSSHDSIATGGGMMFFFNAKGVWITTGEFPQLVSRAVQKWIDAIDPTFYANVSGFCDNEHYYCSVGDCTVDGRSFNNVVLRYTIATKEWSVFSYANEFRRFAQFVDSGEVKIVAGDVTARVLQIESSSLDDNGTNIAFEIESQDQDLGSIGIIKEISERVMMYGVNTVAPNLSIQVDGLKIYNIGTCDRNIDNLKLSKPIKGHYFNFIVTGTSNTARYVFKGIELPNVTPLDYA